MRYLLATVLVLWLVWLTGMVLALSQFVKLMADAVIEEADKAKLRRPEHPNPSAVTREH